MQQVTRLAALAIAIVFSTSACVTTIEPGEVPKLSYNESLLVLPIVANMNYQWVELEGKAHGTDYTLRDIKVGDDNFLVLQVRADSYCVGKYRTFFNYYTPLEDATPLCFEARAGEISYDGHLFLAGAQSVQQNNFKQFLSRLEKDHPKLYQRFTSSEGTGL